MEDLFHPSVKAVVIDGKTFDSHKDHDAPGKYGKFVFAERVVKPNAKTIDFSQFAPLLDRILAVMTDYTSRIASSSSAVAPPPAALMSGSPLIS